MAYSELLQNIEGFCIEFERLRRKVNGDVELKGLRTKFGEIKDGMSNKYMIFFNFIKKKI